METAVLVFRRKLILYGPRDEVMKHFVSDRANAKDSIMFSAQCIAANGIFEFAFKAQEFA